MPEHRYSVKVLYRGPGRWPALKGQIFERDMLIGTFTRKSADGGFIPPFETKFYSTQARNRFDDFADSLSIGETIEALLPKECA